MNIEEYLQRPEYTQIAILRRLRVLGGVKATDVALAIHRSQGNLTLMENGRYPATEEVIQAYAAYLEEALHLKRRGLYDVLTRLSDVYPVYSPLAQKHPIDYIAVYIREMCGGGDPE